MFKNLVSLLSTIFSVLFFFKLFSKRDSYELKYKPKRSDKKETKTKAEETEIEVTVIKKLNNRQKKTLKLLKRREVLLPSDIYELHTDVSKRTLRRDMTALVELGFAKQEGSTRDTKYILIN